MPDLFCLQLFCRIYFAPNLNYFAPDLFCAVIFELRRIYFAANLNSIILPDLLCLQLRRMYFWSKITPDLWRMSSITPDVFNYAGFVKPWIYFVPDLCRIFFIYFMPNIHIFFEALDLFWWKFQLVYLRSLGFILMKNFFIYAEHSHFFCSQLVYLRRNRSITPDFFEAQLRRMSSIMRQLF